MELLHTSLFFLFFIHKFHTNGICTYLSFSVFFFVDYYLCNCDQCHVGIFGLIGIPHSSYVFLQAFISMRNQYNLFNNISNPLLFLWSRSSINSIPLTFDPLTNINSLPLTLIQYLWHQFNAFDVNITSCSTDAP